MGQMASFLANELDRVDNYLSMAKANLIVIRDLCDDRCKQLAESITEIDEKVFDYLEDELSILDAKISSSKEIIANFKHYFFDLKSANYELNRLDEEFTCKK